MSADALVANIVSTLVFGWFGSLPMKVRVGSICLHPYRWSCASYSVGGVFVGCPIAVAKVNWGGGGGGV